MASDQTIHPRHHWPATATELYLRENATAHRGDQRPVRGGDVEAVQLRAGDRVLDVGCGLGTTTIDAARLVSRNGGAVGIDITVDLLNVARQNAATAGLTNVEFVGADAQIHSFRDAEFDSDH